MIITFLPILLRNFLEKLKPTIYPTKDKVAPVTILKNVVDALNPKMVKSKPAKRYARTSVK